MKVTITLEEKISKSTIAEMNEIISTGFGIEPSVMLADTTEHVTKADIIQTARLEDGSAAAIAMYRECLWR